MGNWSISKGLNREKSNIKQSENVKKTVHVNVKKISEMATTILILAKTKLWRSSIQKLSDDLV